MDEVWCEQSECVSAIAASVFLEAEHAHVRMDTMTFLSLVVLYNPYHKHCLSVIRKPSTVSQLLRVREDCRDCYLKPLAGLQPTSCSACRIHALLTPILFLTGLLACKRILVVAYTHDAEAGKPDCIRH